MAEFIEIQRQPDGQASYLLFTGGVRAANVAEGTWRIEPVLANEKPCASGPLKTKELRLLIKRNDYRAIALHQFGWTNGIYHSSWVPIVFGKANPQEGPAGLWSNIAGNIARVRTRAFFDNVASPTEAEVARALDNRSSVEALARYISLSLRSMEISLEQITEHYHEQLVNHMAAGQLDGKRSDDTLSKTLYAHVHSFFLHVGAARDYLGALVAHRIGLDVGKIDSMARLVEQLRQVKIPNDALLNILFSRGDIVVHPEKSGKYKVAGWMQEVTSIRNELVHKRPYGSKFGERFGWAIAMQKEAGLFRYFRPLELDGNTGHDALDVLHHHYTRATELFYEAAKASGSDTAMMHLTDKDIISFKT